MPWNNNSGGQGGGGGPWGSPPPRNPWGSGGGNRGGGGRGPQPPDIEDLLRKSQERVKAALPGGFGGAKGIAGIVGLLIVVWLASGFYRVQPSQLGVELRFGQFTTLTEPGLRYHLPAPIETVIRPEVTRVNRLDVGMRGEAADARRGVTPAGGTSESFMLTSDQNIVNVNFAVIWQIADPVQFLFNIREQEATIKAVAESAMRETMGRTQVDQAITENRGGVETAVFQRMQQVLDEYQAGVRIVGVQLQAVDPPGPVIDAFNEVQRANADRVRLENEAQAYANEILPRAGGESQRLLNEAQGYKAEVVARATGDAQRFLSVLEAYRQAPDVTQQRIYIETMEQVLKNANKIVIDKDTGGAGGQPVVPYLSLDPLRRSPTGGAQ